MSSDERYFNFVVWFYITIFCSAFLWFLFMNVFTIPEGDRVCKFDFENTSYRVYVTDISYDSETDKPDIIFYYIYEGFTRDLFGHETVYLNKLDGEAPTDFVVRKTKAILQTELDEQNARIELEKKIENRDKEVLKELKRI